MIEILASFTSGEASPSSAVSPASHLRASADRRARLDTGDASRRRFGPVTRLDVRTTETAFFLVRAYPRGL